MAKNQTSFKPGEGGRQAGSPNKLTKELRIILKEILSQEIILPVSYTHLDVYKRQREGSE